MAYELKLEKFSGPLEKLLELIEAAKNGRERGEHGPRHGRLFALYRKNQGGPAGTRR